MIRTDEAEKIAETWINADYSEAHKLYASLPAHKRNSLRCALITAALHGITAAQNEMEAAR